MYQIEKEMELDLIENKKSTDQFEYSIQMSRWLLQLFGMWPAESRFYSRIRFILVAMGSYLFIFLLVPCSLYTFVVEKDLKVRLRLMGPQSFCLMNICKYVAVLLKSRDIREYIHWMEDDWQKANVTERKIMLQSTETSRLFTKICVIFMYGSGMVYTGIFNFTQEPILVRNVSMMPITYPSYYIFFDPYTRPYYDVIVVTHLMAGFLMYTVTCAVCSITITFIMHICGQIDVSSWLLNNLVGNFEKEAFNKIIVKHLRSLQFATKLEDILRFICLVEMSGCTFNICMLLYYFITEYNQGSIGPYIYCLLVISFIFNIFIFCYFGDRLTEQCDSIGEAAYSVDWYLLSKEEARNIVFIVTSTQHSVVLTAGKMATLSLENFSNVSAESTNKEHCNEPTTRCTRNLEKSVLKAALTYLNMLRTVTTAN